MAVKNEKLAISQLSPYEAELLLRKVMKGTELYQANEGPKLVPSKQLFEELMQSNSSLIDFKQATVDDISIAQQALMVLAADKAFEDYIINPEKYTNKEKPTSFGIDPISILSLTTLAMVVLSTYIHIRKDKNGAWTFELKITPMSDKLKKELFSLIKKLTSGLS